MHPFSFFLHFFVQKFVYIKFYYYLCSRLAKLENEIMTNKEILFGIIGTMMVFGLIYFSAWKDNQWQKKVNAEGGYVGVANRSDHRVALQFFGHDSTGVVLRNQVLEPNSEWIIRDSMSKAEVTAFPPEGFVDSALLVFDDTLPVWHKGEYPWDVKYDDHCIHVDVHWSYESPVIRQGFRGRKTIYRPTRVYTLTNDDYNRAVDKTK